MKTIAILLTILFFCTISEAQELRGAWSQVPWTTNAEIDTMVGNLEQAHQNSIFLLISKSATISSSRWSYLLQQCKAKGIDVHVWIVMFGYSEDPNSATVRATYLEHLKRFARTYTGAKGLHMDYIRYPSGASNKDPNIISNFVHEAYDSVKVINPNLLLSAAVGHDQWAPDIAQYWWDWVNGGYIDFVVIMNYEESTSFHLARYSTCIGKVTAKDRVFDGIAITQSEARYVTDPITVEDRVIKVRALGCKGFVFFDQPFSSAHISKLNERVFSAYVSPYYPGGTPDPNAPTNLKITP